MYKHNTIKQNILIAFFAILLIGCGGGGGGSTTSTGSSPSIKAIHEGQVKDTATGQGLENVEVSIGSHTVITDAEGYYRLSGLTENEESIVNFKKNGYLLGSTKIRIKMLSGDNTPSTNYLEYTMDTYDYQWSYNSETGASNSNIGIPAFVYTDTAGGLYTGTVSAALEIQDVTTKEGKELFPGSFKGLDSNGQITQFVSYGLISLSFKDTNDNALNFISGAGAILKFNTVPSSEQQNIIPLWYYDYTKGSWIEEGYAERQTDGTYHGEISHPGTWSLNKPIESDPGIYRGRIVNVNGSPVSDIRLHAVGDNWMSSDLSTDENGLFEIAVIPGKSFQLAAYDYKNKYGATYNATIPAIASGDIVEN